MKNNRRRFLKQVAGTLGLAACAKYLTGCTQAKAADEADLSLAGKFVTPKCLQGMPIHATFLDEVSWDIPHQNWGPVEWDRDFASMKRMGINTVVLIRAGLGSWIAAPFESVMACRDDIMYPPLDLVEMFLTLSDKHDMKFFFGMYDSGYFWHIGEYQKEIDVNLALIDEVWEKYGHHKSFAGWYLSQEVSSRTRNISSIFAEMAVMPKRCQATCRQ